MGITLSPTSQELEYHNLNYSNLEAIQGILRFYIHLKSTTAYKPNTELICILADISTAINRANLTERQKQVLKLYILGFTETEIGKKLEITQQAINNHIKLICKKISNYLVK